MIGNKFILSGKPLGKAELHTDCMLMRNLFCWPLRLLRPDLGTVLSSLLIILLCPISCPLLLHPTSFLPFLCLNFFGLVLSSALSLWFLQFVAFAAVLVFLCCSFHSLNSGNTAVSNGCTGSFLTNLSACSQTSSMKKLLTMTIFTSYLVSSALPPVVFFLTLIAALVSWWQVIVSLLMYM